MKIYNIKHTKQLTIPQVIASIILSIVFLPILVLFGWLLIRLKNYCKAPIYKPTKLTESYADRVHLTAHRGFRALAPENTLPAYEKAGEAHFWGAENDIHRTKDGVWVLHHDYYTYRMMNKNFRIENVSFNTLLKLHIDNGSNYNDYPNLKIATLEDYLKICAKYNMVSIIEIKGKKNTKYLNEVVDLVKKYNVEAHYIAFSFNAVLKMRELTDAKLFYLTKKISDKKVKMAKSVTNCGISFDGNNPKNQSKNAVNMITSEGLEAAIWAVDDLKLVEDYIDWGVKYVTTNQIHY